MTGFVLEKLYPNGWRRSNELFWRFEDANHAAKEAIGDLARAVRVLPVRVSPYAVHEINRDRDQRSLNNDLNPNHSITRATCSSGRPNCKPDRFYSPKGEADSRCEEAADALG